MVRLGLACCGRNYRALLLRFGAEHSDYQRFMDFLRHHRLKPDGEAEAEADTCAID